MSNMCASVKVTPLSDAEKFISKYLNSRKLLMSNVVQFESGLFWQYFYSLLNAFFFDIHSFISPQKKTISRPIMRVLEKMWSSVSTVSNLSILSTVSN